MEPWEILDEKGNRTGKTIERGKIGRQGVYHFVVNIWSNKIYSAMQLFSHTIS